VVNATRTSRDLRLGASPRATLQLLRVSRAAAALAGRDYVSPDDVAGLATAVLAHRVLPSTDAQLARRTVDDVVSHLVASVHLPDHR
jgi:MoxR-like ATPase